VKTMDDDIKMVDGEFYAKCEYCGTWVIGLIKCCDECARKNWVNYKK